MSRTYRRKSGDVYYWFDKNDKARVALYHSDKRMTMNQVPKYWKVHWCRRPFRRKEKQALFLAVRFIGEDIVFPKPVKDAMYYW